MSRRYSLFFQFIALYSKFADASFSKTYLNKRRLLNAKKKKKGLATHWQLTVQYTCTIMTLLNILFLSKAR